ncbi:MAG: amphi-Trp domain-containing protein [Chloroflexota bacterium]|nr:amphi-Trp domain-containing protein [Chloroflexota bacterium]
MSKKTVLFRSEEWKARRSTAAFLREVADKLEEGEITLLRGEEELGLTLPETVELEIEVTEKVKKHKTEREIEIEIEWTEEQAEGPVTLG